jgi:hypothetical protein
VAEGVAGGEVEGVGVVERGEEAEFLVGECEEADSAGGFAYK